jgi:prepilin-type N-terminal cleavage/methylation domain-containing protein/prepilin-type processing-associated H-X9-DG protein
MDTRDTNPAHPAARKSSSRGGFSLVELLVVIGIIGVLIAILLPVLGRARRAAGELTCAGQIRQLTLAFTMQAQEKRRLTVPCERFEVEKWYVALGQYLGAAKSEAGAADEADVVRRLLECPQTERDGQKRDGAGTARAQWWIATGDFRGSYGLNGWLDRENAAVNAREKAFPHWSAIRHPTEVPVFADAIWYYGVPLEDDTPAPNLSEGEYTGSRNYMSRFAIDRHRMAINVGFCDGSVRRVPLGELWKLKWHRTWQGRDVKLD